MRGSSASRKNFESTPFILDQLEEDSMEARVARIESDVGSIKDTLQKFHGDLREFRGDLKAANESVAELRGAMAAMEARLEGRIDASEQRTDTKLHAMETRIIKWFVGTAITLTGAAFTVAKCVN